MVLTEHQLGSVLAILNGCEEMKQTYKGDNKGSRGPTLQYADEILQMDSRGGFTVKPLDNNYYDTLKLVNKLGKA